MCTIFSPACIFGWQSRKMINNPKEENQKEESTKEVGFSFSLEYYPLCLPFAMSKFYQDSRLISASENCLKYHKRGFPSTRLTDIASIDFFIVSWKKLRIYPGKFNNVNRQLRKEFVDGKYTWNWQFTITRYAHEFYKSCLASYTQTCVGFWGVGSRGQNVEHGLTSVIVLFFRQMVGSLTVYHEGSG